MLCISNGDERHAYEMCGPEEGPVPSWSAHVIERIAQCGLGTWARSRAEDGLGE